MSNKQDLQSQSANLSASAAERRSRLEQSDARTSPRDVSHSRYRNEPAQSRSKNGPLTTNMSEQFSQYRSSIYYSQVGQSHQFGSTVFYNENTPGRIRTRTIEQLEYENSVLLQQLHERDEVVAMYKSGWAPDRLPINDELVSSLNLQLAQKNVLIEQFHRSLVHFEEFIQIEKIQLSQACAEQMQKLHALILSHEQYPIMITQRLIDTSVGAQTIYIREESHTKEWEYKLEQYYQEIVMLQEKVSWYERETHTFQQTIAGLHGQLEHFQRHKGEIDIFQQQIVVLNQKITQYEQTIHNLKIELGKFQNQSGQQINQERAQHEQQVTILNQQITVINQKITQYEQTIHNLRIQLNKFQSQSGQISHEKGQYEQQITILNQQITVFNQKISQYEQTINNLKMELDRLQRQSGQGSHDKGQYEQQITVLNQQITVLNQQFSQKITIYEQTINNLHLEIQKLQKQINGNSGDDSRYVNQINALNQQITVLNQNISQYKETINNLQLEIQNLQRQLSSGGNGGNNSNIARYEEQISTLNIKITTLEQTINQYKIQINSQGGSGSGSNYNDSEWELQSLKRENERLTNELKRLRQDNDEHDIYITKLKQEIKVYQQEISVFKNQPDNDWEIQSLKRENQRLNKELKRLREENDGYDVEISKLKQEIWNYKSKLTRLENELSDYELDFKRKESEYQTLITKFKTQVEYYMGEYESLKNKPNTNTHTDDSTIRYEIEKEVTHRLEIEITRRLQSTLRVQIYEQLKIELYRQFEDDFYRRLEEERSRIELEIRESLTIEIRRKLEIEFKRLLEEQKHGNEQEIRDKLESELYIRIERELRQKLEIEITQRIEGQLRHRLEIQITQRIERELRQKLEIEITQRIERELRQKLEIEITQRIERQLRQRLEIQIYQRIEQELTINIRRQYELKLQQSYEDLNKSHEEIKYLMERIRELEVHVSHMETQYNLILKQLDEQQFNQQTEQLQIEIEEWKANLSKAEIYILELETRIKDYSNIEYYLREKENEIIIIRGEYEQRITILESEIERLNALIKNQPNTQPNNQLQKETLKREYEQRIILLQTEIDRLHVLIKNWEIKYSELEHSSQVKTKEEDDQFAYMIDSRYKEIQQKLLKLSSFTQAYEDSEIQFWQAYQQRRRKEFQNIQTSVSESLSYVSQIQQSIIVHRSQLHRLNLGELESVIREIQEIKRTQGSSSQAAQQLMRSRFYEVLQQVGHK